jgi:nicotinate-nucleotide adenylyltransferase
MSERIGLMGGMFDPPHPGHRAIASSFLRSGYIDRLWILPTAHPPHKGPSETSFEHRLAMCRFAFDGLSSCDIQDVESELPAPNYTIHTLLHLKSEFPEAEFCLCIGADSLHSFHRWHRWEELIHLAPVLVASRTGFETAIPEVLRKASHQIQFIRHDASAESSTEIRAGLAADLHPKVRRYIALNGLYAL